MSTIIALALTCAPNIHPDTLKALVRHESSANRYAIGVNDPGHRLQKQPATLASAQAAAQELIAASINFDAGLGQINVRNWGWLGLDAETVFDPCKNLAATQTVLSECYARALKRHQATQQAIRSALSCYNTGSLTRGFQNGYVRHVLMAAGIRVPALGDSDSTTKKSEGSPPSKPAGTPDGFSANPTEDGFTQPPPSFTQDQQTPAA